MNDIKKLELHDFHDSKSAKFTEFAGWNMPVSYGSSINEHIHTRSYCSLFDVSHMGEIRVTGRDSTDFLDFVLTNSVSNVKNGKAVYSPICNKDGGTVDDLIAYKISELDYLLCVNASNVAKDYKHLLNYTNSFNCSVENVSDAYGQLAVQGPLSEVILSKIINKDLSNLAKMTFCDVEAPYGKALIARTGYTGEDGFEIYFPVQNSLEWASSFDKLEESERVQWAGLAARDSLRLESRFPLYGHEISESISPLSANLNWCIKWNKKDFLGKSALLNEKQFGSMFNVLYYEVGDRRIPRDGAKIFFDGTKVGEVLSGGFSPTFEKPIGSMRIEREVLDKRDCDGWSVEVRKSKIPIKISTKFKRS
jgi:aminomethyltransferase